MTTTVPNPAVGGSLPDDPTTGGHVVAAEPESSLIPTLPGRYYTDPAVFEREQEVVFERMWFCAVRSG